MHTTPSGNTQRGPQASNNRPATNAVATQLISPMEKGSETAVRLQPNAETMAAKNPPT